MYKIPDSWRCNRNPTTETMVIISQFEKLPFNSLKSTKTSEITFIDLDMEVFFRVCALALIN